MTANVPTWFAPMYNDKVIHKFQSSGFLLKGTTSEATEIKSNEANWRLAAPVAATLYKRGNDANLAGGDRTKVSAMMETWQVYDIVYDDDLEKMPINEMDIVAQSGAKALGRAFDTQIGLELQTNAPAAVVTDAAAGLTLAAMLGMCQKAQAQTEAMWDGNWYCPLPSNLWNQALAYKQFNNSDYTGGDLSFTKVTTAKSWNGVHWFLMPDSWFSMAGANVDVFLWHRDAVGYASNYAPKTNIAWEQAKTAFTSNMRMAGKSKILLAEGIVRGTFKKDAAITPN